MVASVVCRHPAPDEGLALFRLVRACPPLDLNSAYAYHLLCRDFYETCVIAAADDRVCGFISAYFRPAAPDTLFVWQTAVAPDERGRGLASQMLDWLLARPVCARAKTLETTINPGNLASRTLFTRFSERRGATLETTPFLGEESFEGNDHEAEILLRITPLRAGAAPP